MFICFMYTKKVLQYFRQPKNYGKLKDADGIGTVGNLVCGDVMKLYIKTGKNKKGQIVIKESRFETFGCVAALATSSMITELSRGKTIEKALKVSKKAIINGLGGLPPIKIHCSLLAIDALHEAIYDYLFKQKKPIPEELERQHQRIEREKKIIEEKYKNWIQLKTK